MENIRIYFYVALSITLITLFLLVTGSSILLWSFDGQGEFPIGNLITWAGMIAFPFTIYYGIASFRNPKGTWQQFLSRFLKVVIVLAILWVPVSYLLSGNLSFTFSQQPDFQGSERAMKIFWVYSLGAAIGAFLNLILYWVSLLIVRIRKKG